MRCQKLRRNHSSSHWLPPLQGDRPPPIRQVSCLRCGSELSGHLNQVGEGIRLHLLLDLPTVCWRARMIGTLYRRVGCTTKTNWTRGAPSFRVLVFAKEWGDGQFVQWALLDNES